MTPVRSKVALAAAAAAASALFLAGCSSDDASDTVSTATSAAASAVDSAKDGVSSAVQGAEGTTSAQASGEASAAPSAGASASASAGASAPAPAAGAITGPAGALSDVDASILTKYASFGGGVGHLGNATGPQEAVGDGFAVPFKGATIFASPTTGAHLVQGEILRVYTEQGGPAGDLGFPTTDESTVAGGWSSSFSGGDITWTDLGGGTFGETVTPK